MKGLVLYYSYSGNTEKVAKMIQRATGFDIAEIKPVKNYEGDYNSVVNQGKKEVDNRVEPEIVDLKCDLSQYDTVVLGSPVWWYTFAPPVRTVLSGNNWSGKVIYPFATNGGWLGHTFEDIKDMCRGAEVKSGLNLKFSGTAMKTKKDEIEKWTESIKQGGEL